MLSAVGRPLVLQNESAEEIVTKNPTFSRDLFVRLPGLLVGALDWLDSADPSSRRKMLRSDKNADDSELRFPRLDSAKPKGG